MTTEINDTIERYVIAGTGPYAFSFRVFDEDELAVTTISADLVPTLLTEGTNYSVTGVNDEDGGSITLVAGTATSYAGYTLDIRSNTTEYQPTSIRNQGAFLPEIHEDAFDRLSRQIQDVARKIRASIRYPDDEIGDAVMPPVASRKGRYLFANAITGVFEWVTSVTTTALSQSIFNQYLTDGLQFIYEIFNPRTSAEIAAGVTPTFYVIPSADSIDVSDAKRYGFREGNTETQNATALTTAIAVMQEYNSYEGGVIQLPPGNFVMDSQIEIPHRIIVKGQGPFATFITNGDAQYLFKVGGNATGVIKENCGVESLGIEMTHKDGHAIRLMECRNASIRRLYMEGTVIASRSNIFITIDGGDISAYFNHIEDCTVNHVETLAVVTASGIGNATSQFFTNVCGTGDKASFPSSIGVRMTNGHGSGTVWVHGNLEQFGTGWRQESGCQACTILAARFEGNTNDIVYQATAGALTVVGSLITPNTISNLASDTYDHLSLIACVDGSHDSMRSRMPRGAHLIGVEAGDGTASECPLLIEGYPGWTTDRLIRCVNSGGTELFAVSNEGHVMKQVYRSGSATPVGAITPRFIGEEFLDTVAGDWYKSTGTTSANWVALN